MIGEKHDLLSELPEYKEQIHELKINNSHFAKLYAQYHEVEHEVRRIEEGVENTSDDFLEERKKVRLNLKDQLFTMIKQVGTETA